MCPPPPKHARLYMGRRESFSYVVVAELEADVGPLVVVALHGDAAVRTLLGPHRPVLLEGARPLDGRLVDARALVDFVRALLGREVAHRRPGLVRREVPVRLDHVVLDQRVAGLQFSFASQPGVEELA